MKNLAGIIAIIIVLTSCNSREKSSETSLPNIVLIFIDDQGYADLGCYGAKGFETPNIDKLAQEGIRFTNFYVSEAVCSASRASLLTGCYAQRVNIKGALHPMSQNGLNPKETTLASMLKERGYVTAIFGKWHLGHMTKFLPFNFGFDEYFGLPYSNDMWPVGYDGKPKEQGFNTLYPTLYLIDDSSRFKEVKTLQDQAELTTLYTQRAVDFINRNSDNPFFLYLPHSMVHVPLAVSEKYKGKSEQGMYGDVMMEVDWSVGEVMKALNENGLADNTLIIYTSDNGPWLNFGNHGGSAYPLREGKGTAWEGGVRVPGIMKWPEQIKPNVVTDEFVTTLDILPTIAAITDSPLPEKEIDGINMLPFLTGEIDHSPRQEFYYYYEGNLCAVRKGEWKLVFPHKYRSYEGVEPGKDGWPGPYARGEAVLELYNLKEDIFERINVIDQHPEIVENLSIFAEAARRSLGDGLTDSEGDEIRPCGRIGSVGSTINKAKNKEIELKFSPSKKYDAKGPSSLIDGILGSYDFSDGNWLGFRENDLNLIIDLGGSTSISEISARFLLNQTSWIFLPGEVEISVSDDNKKFTPIFRNFYENGKKDLRIDVRQIGIKTDIQTRFVEFIAKGIGTCPEWHPGRDELGWLFVDEIIIK